MSGFFATRIDSPTHEHFAALSPGAAVSALVAAFSVARVKSVR